MLAFKVAHGKVSHDLNFEAEKKVSELKEHLETITKVPKATMKLLYKGTQLCN